MEKTFTGLAVMRTTFSFRMEFAHNLAARSEAEALLVVVAARGGGVGYGQVLPRSYLTGETMDSAMRDIGERWWPRIAELEVPLHEGWGGCAAAFAPIFNEADARGANASYAGVDVAAMSAFAASAGVPVWPVRAERPLPLVGVIPRASPKTAIRLARLLKWLGYRRFKVKVARHPEDDTARLKAVRRAVGLSCALYADANGAWEWDEAIERIRGMSEFGVSLAEEPLNAASAAAADFRRLERETGVAVMADESLCTTADAAGLLDRGAPSWWNIRLCKNGGYSGAAALADYAKRNGAKIYGGVLVGETGAMAAAARAAFFGIGAECGEYGFPRVFLKGDPFRGSPPGYRGVFSPPDGSRAGTGVSAKTIPLLREARSIWIAGDGAGFASLINQCVKRGLSRRG